MASEKMEQKDFSELRWQRLEQLQKENPKLKRRIAQLQATIRNAEAALSAKAPKPALRYLRGALKE